MVAVCAGALVVRRRGTLQVLLGKRTADRETYPGVWDVPGGRCEPGETPEHALARELREELGITPTTWRPLGAFRVPEAPNAGPLVLHLYVVTAWAGTPHNRQPAEHAEIAWFDLTAACALDLADPRFVALFRQVMTPPA